MGTQAFLEARSLPLDRRERYEDAVGEFRWPVPDATRSFAELSARSSQVARTGSLQLIRGPTPFGEDP